MVMVDMAWAMVTSPLPTLAMPFCCDGGPAPRVSRARSTPWGFLLGNGGGKMQIRSRNQRVKNVSGSFKRGVCISCAMEESTEPATPQKTHFQKFGQQAFVFSLALLQSMAPIPPLEEMTPLSPLLPAHAVLNSPNTKIPRTPEVALRRSIPAVNPDMKTIQDTLEDIFYLLRIPQRKPYSTMQTNVEKAIKVANQGKAGILAAVPAADETLGLQLFDKMVSGRDGLEGLLAAITDKDPDKVSVRLASSLETIAQLELLQTPGLPFLLPAQYQNLPRLTGRATVEFQVEKGDGSFTVAAGGGPQKFAKLEMVLDGYSAPLTAGNFADMVVKKGLDGVKIRNTEFAVLSEATVGRESSALPLEVKPQGEFQPIYRTPLDVQDGELPVLPLSVFGAVAMSHASDSDSYSSPTQFFFYLYDKRNSGLGGLTFDEGQFSVFGYVTKGRELLSQLKTGDVINSARIISGEDRLVIPTSTL